MPHCNTFDADCCCCCCTGCDFSSGCGCGNGCGSGLAADLASGWSRAGAACLMPIAVIAAINVIRASPALPIMNGAALQTGFTWFQESAITHTHTYLHHYSCQSESDQPIGLWVPKHEARLNNPRALREIKNPSNNDKSSRQAKRRRRTTTDSQTMMELARPGKARQAGRQTGGEGQE